MSETDKGNMDLPPVGVFTPDERGLVAWSPVFDRISVSSTADGVRLEVERVGEPTVRVELTPVAARWLADLLRTGSFAEASLVEEVGARGVSRDPVDGHPVISFDVAGSIVRYRLTEDSAAFLRGALGDLDQIGRRSHSDRSSGNPTSDVSTPFEGVKV